MLQILQVSTWVEKPTNSVIKVTLSLYLTPVSFLWSQITNQYLRAVHAESSQLCVFNSEIRLVTLLSVTSSSQQVRAANTVRLRKKTTKQKQTYICTLVCQVTDSFFWANCQFHWNNPAWLGSQRRKTGQNFSRFCYGTLSYNVIITGFIN